MKRLDAQRTDLRFRVVSGIQSRMGRPIVGAESYLLSFTSFTTQLVALSRRARRWSGDTPVGRGRCSGASRKLLGQGQKGLLGLKSCQWGPKADVNALPKRHMRVRIACDIEAVSVRILGGVAVGGGEDQ